MRALMILAGILSIGLYYLMEIDQLVFPELSLWLMEQQTALGFSLWSIPLASIGLFAAVNIRTRSAKRRKEELNQLLRDTVARNTKQHNQSSHHYQTFPRKETPIIIVFHSWIRFFYLLKKELLQSYF